MTFDKQSNGRRIEVESQLYPPPKELRYTDQDKDVG